MHSDPSDPSSCTLNLSSDSMDIPAMVVGPGSRSSSVSSSGHRVRVQDDQGRTLVPVHPPSRSSRDIEMGLSTPLNFPEVQRGPHLSKTQVLHLHAFSLSYPPLMCCTSMIIGLKLFMSVLPCYPSRVWKCCS